MAQRNRSFWLKTLMVATLAILIVDMLTLTCMLGRLAASQQKRAEPSAVSPRLTNSPAEQALILPTHDPGKPWVTRTPRPTATPWLILAATLEPQRQATPGPGENAAQVATDAARVGTGPGSSGVLALAALSPQTTVRQPDGSPGPISSTPLGVEPADPISPTPSPSAGIVPADTPTSSEILPTETLDAPASTPSPTQLGGTDQPPPPIVPGDQARFTAYVMDQYGTIAGQALNIASVTLDTTEDGVFGVVVELVGDGANNVFAAQTAAVALDYGHRLLNDLKSCFSGQYYALAVASTYNTSNSDACINNPTWCDLDTFDASANTWTVTWTHVRGTSVDGMASVDTGNTGQ